MVERFGKTASKLLPPTPSLVVAATRFLIAKDGKDFILFHSAYCHEYYKLPQWEHKGAEVYKKTWSLSNKEGMVIGYNSSGKLLER
jgi:hypothetical protein